MSSESFPVERTMSGYRDSSFTSQCTCLVARQCLLPRKPSSHKKIMYSIYSGILIILILCVLPIASSQNLEGNDINSLLNHGDSQAVAKQPLEINLPDATAILGRMFRYSLKDHTKGNVLKYLVTEVGKDSVPSWLMFDEKTVSLKGVPSEHDTGHLFLEAIASTIDHKLIKDVFTIHVKHESTHTSAIPVSNAISDSPIPIRCHKKQPVTMVTIIMDTDYNKLTAVKKYSLLEKMMGHLKLGPDALSLLPKSSKPLFDASALAAGPGNIKDPKYSGALVTWKVGCGNVEASQMPVLEKLETTCQDGSMARDVGHNVIGWHVTSNRVVPRRIRRQVRVTATPGILPPKPTKTVDGFTTIIEVTPTTTEGEMTRTVPSMSSPVATSHTKQTRTKTTGRHVHPKTQIITPSSSTQEITESKSSATVTSKSLPVAVTSSLPVVKPSKVPTIEPSPVVVVTPATMKVTEPSVVMVTPPLVPPTLEPSTRQPVVKETEELPTKATPTLPAMPTTTPQVTTPKATTPQVVIVPLTPKPTKKPRVTKKPIPSKPKTTKKPIIYIPDKTTMAKVPKVTTKAPKETTTPMRHTPSIKNRLKPIRLQLGEVLNFRIPHDTFVDFEDGNTRQLKLLVTDSDGLGLRPTSWIQFNQRTQTLHGLPLAEEIIDIHKFILTAIDSDEKVVRLPFEVIIEEPSNKKPITHEISAKLKLNYDRFIMNVTAQLELSNKLAKYYGDKDMSNLKITKIAKGSVIYAWTNTSLPSEPCPLHALQANFKYLVFLENGTLNPDFIKAMKPVIVESLEVEPVGNCVKLFDPFKVTVGPQEEKHQTSNGEIWIVVIPLVGIAALLLIAGIIAFCLYRRNRKGKWSNEDHHTFINKGIPIIFAEELDDKENPPTKPLMMDDDNKPVQSPPDYKGSRSGSRSSGSVVSTPPSDRKPLDSTIEDDDHDLTTAPLYQPPPPVYPSKQENGRTVRENGKTNYKPVPTYVSP